MKKCPRCRSSMIVLGTDALDGAQPVWHCLGCGLELSTDPRAQAEDDRLRRRIQALSGAQR